MEYFRDPDNKIYAHMAYRIHHIIETNSDYPVTTCLMGIQALLTNHQEWFRTLHRKIQKQSIEKKRVSDIPETLGIKPCFITRNTRCSRVTYEIFLNTLRNALSHPTSSDSSVNSNLPDTGYTTIQGNQGVIEKLIFWNSPDVKDGRPKYMTLEQARKRINDYENNGISMRDVELSQHSNGKYLITIGGKPFVGFIEIQLTPSELKKFALELSKSLYEPVSDLIDEIEKTNRLVG